MGNVCFMDQYNQTYANRTDLILDQCHITELDKNVKYITTTANINIDEYIKFMKHNIQHYVINLCAKNIDKWNIIKDIKRFYINTELNKIICTINNADLYITTNENTLQTVNYLFNTCINTTFSINKNTFIDKLENSTKCNNNIISLNTIDCTLNTNILMHNSITKLYISILDDENFGNLLLPNLTEIQLNQIKISVKSFRSFFKNNSTITNVNLTHNCLISDYDLYYETFSNSVYVTELHMYRLSSKVAEKLFNNSVLEKMVVHCMKGNYIIKSFNNNIKYLYAGGAYFTYSELELLIQSQLLYLNVRYTCDLQTLINKYSNSIALASLIMNQSQNESDKQFAKRVLKKSKTLQYLCDNEIVLSKQYSVIKIDL